MKLSTSKPAVLTPALTSSQVIWQLVQVVWVGGLFLTHFLFLPALQNMAFAPMLVDEVGKTLRPVMVGMAMVGCVFQMLLLIQLLKQQALKDFRGIIIVAELILAVAYFMLLNQLPDAVYLSMYIYLAMGFAGLLLLVQPFPSNNKK